MRNNKNVVNKKLFYFNTLNIFDHLKKGNYTYLRCFEIYFSRNYIIYCSSERNIIFRKGRTIYIGFGVSQYLFVNVLFSPFLLYKFYKRINPNISITTDPIFSFWTGIFIRFFKKYILYPVCCVDEIIKSNQCSFLSINTLKKINLKAFENIFIKLSFFAAPIICLFPRIGYDKFLEQSFYTKHKLLRPQYTVEEYPALEFMQNASLSQPSPTLYQKRQSIKLVTTSRLYKEKMLNEAIEAVKIIIDQWIDVEFFIFGEGPERENLENLATNLDIADSVHFMGAYPNQDLVPFLQNADIYVSISTGTAMREAILCNLPIATYNFSMPKMYFEEHGSLGYITSTNSPFALAEGIKWLLDNKDQHIVINENLNKLKQRWNLKNLEKSLHETFDPYI